MEITTIAEGGSGAEWKGMGPGRGRGWIGGGEEGEEGRSVVVGHAGCSTLGLRRRKLAYVCRACTIHAPHVCGRISRYYPLAGRHCTAPSGAIDQWMHVAVATKAKA